MSRMERIFLKSRQLERIRLTPTFPTISMPSSPSASASARINRANKSTSPEFTFMTANASPPRKNSQYHYMACCLMGECTKEIFPGSICLYRRMFGENEKTSFSQKALRTFFSASVPPEPENGDDYSYTQQADLQIVVKQNFCMLSVEIEQDSNQKELQPATQNREQQQLDQ